MNIVSATITILVIMFVEATFGKILAMSKSEESAKKVKDMVCKLVIVTGVGLWLAWVVLPLMFG